MKRLIFIVTLLLPKAILADKFWVGGTGNSNDPTNHWATITGGAPGAGNTPTAADNCFFDGSSGAGTATINAALACRSIQTAGSSLTTIVHNAAIAVSLGDATAGSSNIALDLSGIGTYTLGDVATSSFSFVSTNATVQTVKTNGLTLGSMTFKGVGSSYLLQDNLTMSGGILTIGAGTVDVSTRTLSVLRLITGSATNSFVFTGSTWTVSGSGANGWATGTNSTFFTTGSSITLTGTNPTLSTQGGKTFYDVVFSGPGVASMSGGSTFHTFSRIGTAIKTDTLTFTAATYTINGQLIIQGNSLTNRVFVGGVVGAGTTFINTANPPVLSNVDIRDIIAGGAGGTWTGTSLGNGLGTTGISYTPAVTRYAVASSTWSDTAMWSASDGGAPGASVPLCHDAVFLNGNTGPSTTLITADMPRLGSTITATGFVGTLTSAITNDIFGDLTLGSGMAFTGGSSAYQLRGRTNNTITNNGITFPGSLTIINPSGTYSLGDAINITATFSQGAGAGTFATNDFMVTTGQFSNASGSTTNLGASTWNMTRTAAGNYWTASAGSTVNPGTSNIVLTNTTANSRTFSGGGKNYYDLSYTVAGSVGTLVISGANTFHNLNVSDSSGVRTLQLPAATITTITGDFNVFGTSAGRITINSSSAGSAATLFKTNGIVFKDWLSLQDSAATGNTQWYAGTHSNNVSGNTGWIFGNPPQVGVFGGMLNIGKGMLSIR